MTARNGSAEWHGSVDSGSGTVTVAGAVHEWWTLVAVCVGTFMLLLDVTIVNVALPKIQAGLGSSFTDLQWVVDAYALTLAALLLSSGSLADLLGRRRIFAIGLVIFSAASLLCGVAQSPLMLNVSRGVQGIGGAMMFAASLALLGNAYRGRDRGVAFGVWGAVTGAAVSIGPVVGGALTDGLSWRWIFLVNVPIGVVALALTVSKVCESRDPYGTRLDIPGFVTFTAALGTLVFGLIESSRRGWGSGLVEGCLIASVFLFAVFLAVERRSRAPMLDLSLFRRRAFNGASIVAFALSGSIFAILLYLTLYLQNVLGLSPLGAGLRLVTLSGAILVTSFVAGRLTTAVPVRLLMGAGLALVGLSLLLMRGLTVSSHWTHLLPAFLVGGVGVGLINPPLASTAIAVVPPRQAGMGSGINSTFRQVGIATGIAALGSIFTSEVRAHVSSGLYTAHLGGAHTLATAISSGQTHQAIAHVPSQARGIVGEVARASFVAGLNEILLVAAILALAGAIAALLLIRSSDFVAQTTDSVTSDHEKRHQERIETMIKHSIEINRPADEVFAYLDQVDRHNEWQGQLVSTTVETDGPIRVGTRVVEHRNVAGGTRDFPYEITEHDRARKISFRGTAGVIRPAGTYTVEPTGESRSRLSSELDLEGHGIGKLFATLARRQAAKQVPVDQEKFKELLESGVALSTSSGSEAA